MILRRICRVYTNFIEIPMFKMRYAVYLQTKTAITCKEQLYINDKKNITRRELTLTRLIKRAKRYSFMQSAKTKKKNSCHKFPQRRWITPVNIIRKLKHKRSHLICNLIWINRKCLRSHSSGSKRTRDLEISPNWWRGLRKTAPESSIITAEHTGPGVKYYRNSCKKI